MSDALIVLPLDLVLARWNIFPANEVALLKLFDFFGDEEGQALDADGEDPGPTVPALVTCPPEPNSDTERLLLEFMNVSVDPLSSGPRKPSVSGGVTKAKESSDDTETLSRG